MRRRVDPASRRAYALLLVLVVVLLLSAAGFLVAAQMQSRMASTLDEVRNVHLRNLVDSGVALGLARITDDRYWTGTFRQSMDGGAVECRIEIDSDSRRKLYIEAVYGSERWRYLFVVRTVPRPPAVIGQRFLPPGSEEE